MYNNRSSDEYIAVYVAHGRLAGEMIRMLLESYGIPAIMLQESAGMTIGLTVGPLGEVKILVPAGRADNAREILSAMEKGKLANSFYPGQLPAYPIYKSNKMSLGEIYKGSLNLF